jgi:hypothetical protein
MRDAILMSQAQRELNFMTGRLVVGAVGQPIGNSSSDESIKVLFDHAGSDD